jgi:hypothetical protein
MAGNEIEYAKSWAANHAQVKSLAKQLMPVDNTKPFTFMWHEYSITVAPIGKLHAALGESGYEYTITKNVWNLLNRTGVALGEHEQYGYVDELVAQYCAP